jgi:hypothetical protein
MGKKSPKVPAAPDPATTAAAQSQTNKDTAYWNAVLNNVNQITPYGNLTYTQSGGGKTYDQNAYDKSMAAYQAASMPRYDEKGKLIRGSGQTSMVAPKLTDFVLTDAPPQFTSKVELSPAQQQLLEIQNRSDLATANLGEQQISRIGDAVSSPFSFGGLGDAPTNESIAEQQARAEEALLARLNPQFSRDEEALRTRLINQGIVQGSEAYNREMEQFGQTKNDARTQAILSGQQYGGTAQQQALQRRNQAIQEYSTQRNAPLNEYIGLTSGTQVQNPQFTSQNYAGAAAPNYADLVNQQYQGQMNAYNNKVASQNANMGAIAGLGMAALSGGMGGFGGGGSLFQALPNSVGQNLAFSLGGTGAMGPFNAFSDIRLKTDIIPDGEQNGHKMYTFKYIGNDTKYRGVMAQDVEKTHPEAVITMPNGFKAVDYGMLGVSMEAV